MKTQTKIVAITISVIGFTIVSLTIGYYYGKKQSIIERSGTNLSQPTQTTSKAQAITGKVLVYSITDKQMTIQLIAQSSQGNVPYMRVWTNSKEDNIWKPFETLITLPISKSVFAQFKDEAGNVSDIYSDTTIPNYSPRL